MAYYSPNINNFTATKQPAGSLDAAKKKAAALAASRAYTQAAAAYAQKINPTANKTNPIPVSQLGQAVTSKTTQEKLGGGTPQWWTNDQKPASSGGGGGGGAVTSGDYYSKYMQMRQAGIMSEYEANASVIKQNLSRALADLDAEQAALAPVYQSSLSTIQANQFQSGEQMKELMNQAGWTGQNSGIAVGEQGKIKIGADTARAEAKSIYDQGVMDVNRRKTLAKDVAGEEQKALEKWKNAQLSGAEAEAWLANDDRIQAAVKASRDYSADLAATAEKNKRDYYERLDAAAAKQATTTSTRLKRANLADIAAAVAGKDMKTLLQIQQAIAQDPELLSDDFDYVYKVVTEAIDKLDAAGYTSTTAQKGGGGASFNLGG